MYILLMCRLAYEVAINLQTVHNVDFGVKNLRSEDPNVNVYDVIGNVTSQTHHDISTTSYTV